jgi:4-azaleucine resistance transporter AzlC
MKKALKFAFIQDIPVMLGYIVMGIAFGLMIQEIGYNFVWAFVISAVVYAGTMQFVLVSILSGGMNILAVVAITLSINSRHIFYGLSFIERFKEMGKAYPYMIYTLTDETYALLCGTEIPPHLDKKKTTFFISLLNQCWWVLGSTLGALAGQLIQFNTTGVDFAMTALFVVLAVEQWLSAKSHIPAIIGLVCGVVAVIVLGPENFIIPALLVAVVLLLVLQGRSEME